MTLPQILTDIVNCIKRHGIEINKEDDEGRVNSKKDELSVKNILEENYPNHIQFTSVRDFGDIIILDYDGITKHVVNIKTSAMSSSDNCYSKVAVVYCLTSLRHDSKLLGPMNLKKMVKLIEKYKHDDPKKDYWYLCIDKKDTSNVICRGAKQICNWKININPNNIMQVNWKKEKECSGVNRSWEEAYDTLVGGAKESTLRFINNLPEEWKQGIA